MRLPPLIHILKISELLFLINITDCPTYAERFSCGVHKTLENFTLLDMVLDEAHYEKNLRETLTDYQAV